MPPYLGGAGERSQIFCDVPGTLAVWGDAAVHPMTMPALVETQVSDREDDPRPFDRRRSGPRTCSKTTTISNILPRS